MSETSRDITREQIINAASQAFSKFGYKKTTLDDIASLTNRGKTGIYYYFKSKDDIFREVIRKEADDIRIKLYKSLKKEKSPADKFVSYVYSRMAAFEKLGNYYNVMKHELMEHLNFINMNRVDFDTTEKEVICSILNEGVVKDVFSIENVNQTAQTILVMLKSLEIPFFGMNSLQNSKEILDSLIQLILNGIMKKTE
jgi:AcrR family transcriptional regulator